jgi:hypothetical protein
MGKSTLTPFIRWPLAGIVAIVTYAVLVGFLPIIITVLHIASFELLAIGFLAAAIVAIAAGAKVIIEQQRPLARIVCSVIVVLVAVVDVGPDLYRGKAAILNETEVLAALIGGITIWLRGRIKRERRR